MFISLVAAAAAASSWHPVAEDEFFDNSLGTRNAPSKDLLHFFFSALSLSGSRKKRRREVYMVVVIVEKGGLSVRGTIIQFSRYRTVAFSTSTILRRVLYLPGAVLA